MKKNTQTPKELVRGPDGKLVEPAPANKPMQRRSKASEVWNAVTRPTYRDPKQQADALRRRGME